jgi:hypothetical protein
MRDEVAARYGYWLKVCFAGESSAEITALGVRTTFVVSPLSLPGRLSRGDNRITFVGGPPAVPVKTACQWLERYQSRLAVSLNSVSYYMNDDQANRNLFVVAPGGEVSVEVKLWGRDLEGEISLEDLPDGWTSEPARGAVDLTGPDETAIARFTLGAGKAHAGEIERFDVIVREGERQRIVSAQVLVADAALVREAEQADRTTGRTSVMDLPEASGAQIMAFAGAGELGFDITAPGAGNYALWLRARWDPQSSTRMALTLDEGNPRDLRAMGMIGFTDWTEPKLAHTKMFAHYGEQYGHWSWYRIPDIHLAPGAHRLVLGAEAGARFDAILLLPQNPAMDRAAMNLFQNWNYVPWELAEGPVEDAQ